MLCYLARIRSFICDPMIEDFPCAPEWLMLFGYGLVTNRTIAAWTNALTPVFSETARISSCGTTKGNRNVLNIPHITSSVATWGLDMFLSTFRNCPSEASGNLCVTAFGLWVLRVGICCNSSWCCRINSLSLHSVACKIWWDKSISLPGRCTKVSSSLLAVSFVGLAIPCTLKPHGDGSVVCFLL